jgi:hypothetical protein
MGKGQTVKNAKSKAVGGTSEGYIFGEEKEHSSVMDLGDLEVFTELKRTSLEQAYVDLFQDEIDERNQEKTNELSEIKFKQAKRKEDRKVAKKNGEDMNLWEKNNPKIKMQSLERYALIEESPLEYFKKKKNFNQNLTLDYIPIIGEMDDYNVTNKYGEKTGLTESEALENRNICTEIMKNVAERWDNEFPQIPLIMGAVHNDSWSTHAHFKCVPVAHYDNTSGVGISKAPGLYTALEQMGIEPDFHEVSLKEKTNEKPLSQKQKNVMRLETLYKKMDTVIEEEMNKFGWEKEVKHATEKDLDKYIELEDLKQLNNEISKERRFLKREVIKTKDEIKENKVTLQTTKEDVAWSKLELDRNKNFTRIEELKIEELDKELNRIDEILGIELGEIDGTTTVSRGYEKRETPSIQKYPILSNSEIDKIKTTAVFEGVFKKETTRIEIEKKDFQELKSTASELQRRSKEYKSFSEKMIVQVRNEESKRIKAEKLLKSDISYRNQVKDLQKELEFERERNGFEKVEKLEQENANLHEEMEHLQHWNVLQNETLKEDEIIIKREKSKNKNLTNLICKVYDKIENSPVQKIVDTTLPQMREIVLEERKRQAAIEKERQEQLERKRIAEIQKKRNKNRGFGGFGD